MTDCKSTKDNTQETLIFSTPKELKEHLKMGQTILGIDYGSKRIGVASSDMLFTIASPVKIIDVKSFAKTLEEFKAIAKEKNAGAIVYGLPKQMDGTEGETAENARKFADKMYKELPLPVLFWDERFSSSAVEKMLVREANISRKKRKKVTDKIAATFILQGVLDSFGFM
jgi:putative Holliday junction resolvase